MERAVFSNNTFCCAGVIRPMATKLTVLGHISFLLPKSVHKRLLVKRFSTQARSDAIESISNNSNRV